MKRDEARDIAIRKLADVGLEPGRRRALPGRAVGRHAEARRPRPRHRDRARDHLLRRADHRPRPDHGRRHQRPDRQCVRELGATALSITHDMASARKIADRIAMLYEGRIIWDGPTAEIDRSGNAYVDQFIHGRADGPIQACRMCVALDGLRPGPAAGRRRDGRRADAGQASFRIRLPGLRRRSPPSGRAAARPAAPGTPWSRSCPAAARLPAASAAPDRTAREPRQGPADRLRRARGRRPRRCRAGSPASPSSTG